MEKILSISRLEVLAIFLAKGRVLETTARRDQRRRKHRGKGMPTPVNHGVGSVAPEDPTGAQKGRFLGTILSSLQ